MPELIEEFLKDKETFSRRLSARGCWMYWDDDVSEWVVVCRPYMARKNKVLYQGVELSAALCALSVGEKII